VRHVYFGLCWGELEILLGKIRRPDLAVFGDEKARNQGVGVVFLGLLGVFVFGIVLLEGVLVCVVFAGWCFGFEVGWVGCFEGWVGVLTVGGFFGFFWRINCGTWFRLAWGGVYSSFLKH